MGFHAKTSGAGISPALSFTAGVIRVEIPPAKYDFPPMPKRPVCLPLFASLPVLVLLPVLALVLSGCGEESEPEPTVRFDYPLMNSTVGPDVRVKLSTTHFEFTGAAAKTSAAAHGDEDVTGHIHLFLDMPAGLDVDAIAQLSKADTVTLTGLKAGPHYLIAEGADASHEELESMTDSVAFTVVVP